MNASHGLAFGEAFDPVAGRVLFVVNLTIAVPAASPALLGSKKSCPDYLLSICNRRKTKGKSKSYVHNDWKYSPVLMRRSPASMASHNSGRSRSHRHHNKIQAGYTKEVPLHLSIHTHRN